MVEKELADTPERSAAQGWIDGYVERLVKALDAGEHAPARDVTSPGFVAGALQGRGLDKALMKRTCELAQQVHDCLSPPDSDRARSAVQAIGRLWMVER